MWRALYDLAGQVRDISFTHRSERILPRLGIVGYFDGAGTTSDAPLGAPEAESRTALRCLTIGHRYNRAPQVKQRFECPDRSTAAGTYTNVFEFDLDPNLVPGSAFRQQDLYTGLAGVGEPSVIWRSDFGIYRRDRDRLYVDFTPAPGANPPFPDFVTTVGQLRNGSTQLVIPDFPAGRDTCSLR